MENTSSTPIILKRVEEGKRLEYLKFYYVFRKSSKSLTNVQAWINTERSILSKSIR